MRLLPRTKISPGESQEKGLGFTILPDGRGGEGSAKMRSELDRLSAKKAIKDQITLQDSMKLSIKYI